MAGNREAVTYEAVAQICDSLTLAGEKVSVRRVQTEVGGGSNTTILGHLRRWQDIQRAASSAGPTDGVLTDAVRAALVTWVQKRETVAKEQAESRLIELDELYGAAKDGWDEALQRINEMQNEFDQAQAAASESIRKLEHALATAQARSSESDKYLNELQERLLRELQGIETSRIQAAEARIRADAAGESVRAFSQENDALRAELRSLQKSHADAEQRAAVQAERAQNREEQLSDLRRELDAQRQVAGEQRLAAIKTEKLHQAALLDLAVCQNEKASLLAAERRRAAEVSEMDTAMPVVAAEGEQKASRQLKQPEHSV